MKRYISEIKQYWEYAIYAGKAELKADVAQSHLSWLWWILDPLCFMLVYTFVAQIVFGRGEQYFSAFIFVGYTSYKLFEGTLKASVRLVASSKSIVSKVYLPKHILLLSKMYVKGFEFCISFMLVFGTMVLYWVPLSWHVFEFIPLVILLFIMTYALSTFLMHFGVYVEDLANVIKVLLRLLFYMSGIFYSLPNRISDPLLLAILAKWNPIAFIIDQMRNVLLYQTGLNWKYYFMWLAVFIVLAACGLHVIAKNENNYVKSL